MNKFDLTFFGKYVPEGQELKEVIHIHPIEIFLSLLVKISLFIVIPVIFYYKSMWFQAFIPFYALEIYLILWYIYLIYSIFNRYNDVWIVSDKTVIWVERSFLRSNSDSINFENIEGVGVEQSGIFDKILQKGDVLIHKIGDDSFILKNAIKPFKAIDTIETLRKESSTGSEDEKFDKVLNALTGVVGEYLGKDKERDKEQQQKKKTEDDFVEKIKKEKGTIDLR